MRDFCNSFEEFATARETVALLAKFEVKYQDKVQQALDGERIPPERNLELTDLIPAGFKFKKRQSGKKRAEALTNFLMNNMENSGPLKAFVNKIAGIIQDGHFNFEKPRLIPQLKEQTPELKRAVYRPLSAYSDLTTKTIIGLEANYLSSCFDFLFHDEMLAYRLPRTYHGQQNKVTTNKDAVPSILEYLSAHKDSDIFVTECDIQKFFDILNHNVILDCFDKMVLKVQAEYPDFKPGKARSLLVDFLESYSFSTDILPFCKKKGEDSEFWKAALCDNYDPLWTYEFNWVEPASRRQISNRKDFSDLGIPQGAALSTVLTNIVLQSVDEAILKSEDQNRLFIRYCDDIVLMHTDFSECNSLKEAYAQSLTAHKLIYHNFKDINGHKKDHSSNSYWNQKSKNPFKWGRDNSNSAEWIGFLGFEIRYDGMVRMRRSSVTKKSEKIAKDIRQIHNCQNPEIRERHRRRFEKMTISIPTGKRFESNLLSSHKGITDNPWTARQIKGLERSRKRYGRKFC